jgi:hypothetical protein
VRNLVQLEVELDVRALAQIGDLCLEISDTPTQPRNFEGQGLIRAVAYITEQGARHVG